MATNKKHDVSVLNWMGTLLLFSIPGVNLIADILFLIFAKTKSKRAFAIAWLVLVLLCALIVTALLVALPEQCRELASILRSYGMTIQA